MKKKYLHGNSKTPTKNQGTLIWPGGLAAVSVQIVKPAVLLIVREVMMISRFKKKNVNTFIKIR